MSMPLTTDLSLARDFSYGLESTHTLKTANLFSSNTCSVIVPTSYLCHRFSTAFSKAWCNIYLFDQEKRIFVFF